MYQLKFVFHFFQQSGAAGEVAGLGLLLQRGAQLGEIAGAEIIRAALAAYLSRDSQAQTASCAQRASRWVGMMQGPTDLSTNPDHMSGFGQ